MNTGKVILLIIFINLINGIAVDSTTQYSGYSTEIAQNEIDSFINQTEDTANKYSDQDTYTNIQNTGIITGSAPTDPISMGIKIAQIMWKGLTPVMLTQETSVREELQIGIYAIQLFQGIMYILIVLTMYQLFHNKNTN